MSPRNLSSRTDRQEPRGSATLGRRNDYSRRRTSRASPDARVKGQVGSRRDSRGLFGAGGKYEINDVQIFPAASKPGLNLLANYLVSLPAPFCLAEAVDLRAKEKERRREKDRPARRRIALYLFISVSPLCSLSLARARCSLFLTER